MKKKRILAVLMTAAVGIGSISVNVHTGGTGTAAFPGIPAVTAQAAAPSAAKLAAAAKKPFGSEGLPSLMELDEKTIGERYGVDASWYVSAHAEVPMVSAQVDELAIFQAKDGASKKKILKAVKKYRKKLRQDTMQYPMNLPKIQASKIYTNGNHVCFIMLGYISSSLEENGTEAEQIKGFQKLNQKAVKAIKKQLK